MCCFCVVVLAVVDGVWCSLFVCVLRCYENVYCLSVLLFVCVCCLCLFIVCVVVRL